MKRLIEEVSGEGLEGLLGARVTFFCVNYIYEGKLVGVNDQYVRLDDAGIVYETGPLNEKKWGDRQPVSNPLYIMLRSVEAYTVLK